MNTTHGSRLRGALLGACTALTLLAAPARADWTNLNLGAVDFPNGYVSFSFDQLPDGRMVFGAQNALFRQATFGAAVLESVPAGGQFFDPSSVKVYSSTLGVIGGYGTIYVYNPTSATSTIAAIPGVALQNYSLAFRDATSIYVGGGNGTAQNPPFPPFPATQKHAISYVKLDGSETKLLIDNVSDYSGDFTVDALGNLYVTDSDFGDSTIYRFDKSLIDQVIAGTRGPLHLTDGTLLATLNDTSSVAIDSTGRIWYSGYNEIGIAMYDPLTQTTSTFVPGAANRNYQVATFTRVGQEYISFLDFAATPNETEETDDDYAAIYGYDLVQNIPEPTCGLLLAAGVAVLAHRRRRHAVVV